MKAGAEVYRTPVIPSTGSPEWKWQFDCRLPAPIGSQTWSEDLIFTLFDARTLGDPLVVGSCRVTRSCPAAAPHCLLAPQNARSLPRPQAAPCKIQVLLTDLELQPNALPVEIYLPLLPHSAKIPQAGRLHLGFQLLQRPPGVAASMSAHASGHSRVSNSTLRNANIEAERSAAWQLPSQPAPVREEARCAGQWIALGDWVGKWVHCMPGIRRHLVP